MMLWYIAFWILAIGQLFYILQDLQRDLSMKLSDNYKEATQSPIAAGWLDGFNLSLIGLVLVCGKGILWFVISILILYYIATELIQLINSKCKYFKEKSNWIDIGIIGFLMVLMYVPNDKIVNPHKFSIFDDQNDYSAVDEKEQCRVKRSVSAALIVLIWTRFLMTIAKYPGWKEYNLYVIMFYKVMQRYVKILAWYSCYLIAFGLGFYIMLHNDTKVSTEGNISATSIKGVLPLNQTKVELQNSTENSSRTNTSATTNQNSSSENYQKTSFDNPYLALVKTAAMFVGEIEFGDLPFNGGDINVTFAYFFLLIFIFLMIVVLMNLLNGLAVSDTGIIVEESEISCQITFINTIQYFESVYIGHMGWVRFVHKICPALDCFLKRYLIPRGLLLFHSPYMKKDEKRVTFPLKNQKQLLDFCLPNSSRKQSISSISEITETSSYIKYFTQKFYKIFEYDENFGSEDFLENARKILIQEKSKKMKRRREEMEQRRRKRRQEVKEKRMKNVENILDNMCSCLRKQGDSNLEPLT